MGIKKPPNWLEDKLVESVILLPCLAIILLDRWLPQRPVNKATEVALIIGLPVAWCLFAIGPGKWMVRRLLRWWRG